MHASLDQQDLRDLKEAVHLLENPGWSSKLTSMLGIPIEFAIRRLPAKAEEIIASATQAAIKRAVLVAVKTMGHSRVRKPSEWLHRSLVAASGAAGGFFGLGGLAVELPISTVTMLRSIADIARAQGEDIRSVECQLACVQVFALGRPRRAHDDATETIYYAARLALAGVIADAAKNIAERGFVQDGAPVLVRLFSRIASRFGIVVEEKVAAEALPIIGAVGGAAINLLFINNFQSMARGHFIVRRLESRYGREIVQEVYEGLALRLE